MKKDTDIEELPKTEKVIRFLSLIILIGSFLLTLFFQKGRNILELYYPVGFYWLIYFYLQDVKSSKEKVYSRFYKIARFLLAILCLLAVLNHFMFSLFELILNIQFVKINKTQSMNHPIANWIMQSNLTIFLVAFITLPFLSITTKDDV